MSGLGAVTTSARAGQEAQCLLGDEQGVTGRGVGVAWRPVWWWVERGDWNSKGLMCPLAGCVQVSSPVLGLLRGIQGSGRQRFPGVKKCHTHTCEQNVITYYLCL